MSRIVIVTILLSLMLTGCGDSVLDPTARESAKVLEKCNGEVNAATMQIMSKMQISDISQLNQKDKLKIFKEIAETYDECISDHGYNLEITLKEYLKDGLTDYEKAYALHLSGTYILMTDNLKIPSSEIISAGVYPKEQVQLFNSIITAIKN